MIKLIKHLKRTVLLSTFAAFVSVALVLQPIQAAVPSEASWMAPAKWGISHHYLAGGTLNNAYYKITDYDEWNDYVNGFDVNDYADKVDKLGAGYVIFTVTQNRGYLATTSAKYDENAPPCPSQSVTPGCQNQTDLNKADYTPTRDLILDLATALEAKGIKLIAYLPSHLPDRITGAPAAPSYPDWWVTDFIKEKSDDWALKVAGWWFDGYWKIRGHEQANDFPIATKIYNAVKSGNSSPVITFNNGVGTEAGVDTTHEKFSNFTPGENNNLPPVPSSGEVTGWAGNKAQSVGWTYLSQEDPLFAGWGQIKRNLKYNTQAVAGRAKAIVDAGGVSTWDVAINPNGKWPVDRLVQVQKIGNVTGTSSDTTYSGLKLVNNTSGDINYTGNWGLVSNRGTGEYAQDVHSTQNNGDYFTYGFTGSSIVFATSKASDLGDVEVFIDDVSQGTFSTYDANYRQVQEIIFEKHDLPSGNHTLKVIKRTGSNMLADLVLSKANAASNDKIE